MKAYVVTCPIGVFAFDEKEKLLYFILFEKNPEKIAEKLINVENILLEEEKKLIEELKNTDIDMIYWKKRISFKGIKTVVWSVKINLLFKTPAQLHLIVFPTSGHTTFHSAIVYGPTSYIV